MIWEDQVKPTLDRREPTDHSYLYSKHFEDDCFQPYSMLMAESTHQSSCYCSLQATVAESLGVGRAKDRCNTIYYIHVELTIHEKF